jgi:hypothetical protein
MPRIKMTKSAKFALVVLRGYLLIMLGLILFKFLQILR